LCWRVGDLTIASMGARFTVNSSRTPGDDPTLIEAVVEKR
jgi:hypothetical protein